MTKTLSILVPVYNEENTIYHILSKLREIKLINNIEKEIIVINDGSTDSTENRVIEFINNNKVTHIKYFKNEQNRGKGSALQTGILNAKGDYIVVQDGDLEYDPEEFNILLKPVIDGHADVVYGSRFMGGNPHRVLFFWHRIGNNFLTFLSNLFTNVNLTDIETCYKLFKSDIIKNIKLEEKGFGFEPEITAKITRIKGIRIYEVGISYYGRSYSEGKKINWKDGFRALYCIMKYNLFH
jgi:glycosyltransferase involved in cell wall biosynthesis